MLKCLSIPRAIVALVLLLLKVSALYTLLYIVCYLMLFLYDLYTLSKLKNPLLLHSQYHIALHTKNKMSLVMTSFYPYRYITAEKIEFAKHEHGSYCVSKLRVFLYYWNINLFVNYHLRRFDFITCIVTTNESAGFLINRIRSFTVIFQPTILYHFPTTTTTKSHAYIYRASTKRQGPCSASQVP